MTALNLLGPYPFGNYTTFFDLVMFALGSFVIISMLLLYYSKIPKSNNPKSEFDNPIYLAKDTLLQTTNSEENLLLVEKTTSTFTKILIYTMILIVGFTPLYQLFGVGHFV